MSLSRILDRCDGKGPSSRTGWYFPIVFLKRKKIPSIQRQFCFAFSTRVNQCWMMWARITSFMVRNNVSIPFLGTFFFCLTRNGASLLLLLYTSSTERVPRMARKCPSRVCRIVIWTSWDVLPKNCSEAVWSSSLAVIILHCATPVTFKKKLD